MDSILLSALCISIGFNLSLFFVAYFLQTDKLTDFSYSLCFLMINGLGFYMSDKSYIDWIMFFLISIWAFRLGGYLFIRIMAMGRDARFDEFRERLLSFIQFWIVQAISIFIISLSFLNFYSNNNGVPTLLFWVGISIAVFGLFVETIADNQKFKFKKSNPNEFMQSGLWKKIRHPNYTGEILFWIGIFLAVASYISGWQWTAILSPLWIVTLLLKFSGIPPLEKTWNEKYGSSESFKKYKKQSWRLLPGLY